MMIKHSKTKRILLILSAIIVAILFSGFVVVICTYNMYALDVEKLTSLNNGIKVYSSSGTDNSLYNSNRSIVEIESLPDYVVKAFIDIEDKRFYQHNGYDLKRIAKAGIVNLTKKSKSQGASTISQQLIKNALLSNEKTYKRKVEEIVLAVKLEKQFEKQDILEMYLNTIYFGSNAYGLENASQIYFDKSAKDLNINEACCLAGIIKSPNKYSPKNNYQNALDRRNLVAKAMLDQKDISLETYNQIIDSEIEYATTKPLDHTYEEVAILQACELLNISERELINNEYQIITYKDDKLQEQVFLYNNQTLNQAKEEFDVPLDSVSIVVDNMGRVVAYYANSNYNLYKLRRQPASLIKPLAVYLPCFTHNILSPASIILDEKTNFNGYEPHNAKDVYNGYVSVRTALKQSLNIPAVKALESVGIDNARETLANLNILTSQKDANLSLSLGAMEHGTTILELVGAYNTLANLGEFYPISFIDKILNKKGDIVYQNEIEATQVAEAESCFLVNDILKDVAKSGTAKRLSDLPFEVCSKTGTAYNGSKNTDIYNIAYTPNHTILTWISNLKDNVLADGLMSSVHTTEINKDILLSLYEKNKPTSSIMPNKVELLPYNLKIAQNEHIIVAPNNTPDRYIAYDYFKLDNAPEVKNLTYTTDITATMSMQGVKLNFNLKDSVVYTLYQKTAYATTLLAKYQNQDGLVEYCDYSAFDYEQIEYILIDEFNNKVSVKVRPKDYLTEIFNQQLSKGKRQWAVVIPQ